jgi:hypothetical protein
MIDADLELLPRLIAQAAEPLPDIDDGTFGEFFDRFADARVVLLGEASHGTSEYYRARAAISRHLIERHGFTIVAVEGDWPDAATRFRVRGAASGRRDGGGFRRGRSRIDRSRRSTGETAVRCNWVNSDMKFGAIARACSLVSRRQLYAEPASPRERQLRRPLRRACEAFSGR